MADFERIEALAGLVREKGVNREILLKSLHAGLVKASLREYGEEQDIKVTWEQGSGDIRMEAMKTVVEKIGRHCTHVEIDLKKARKIDPDCEIGDQVAVPISITDFGRSAVNEFRSEFLLLVKSAERNQVWKEYADRIGCIIPRCRVQQVYRNRILVQVAGKIEAVVPADERARGERYDQGDSITPVLIRVEKPESLEPQLVLSRATPDLVRRLFEREAPEIEEGVVQIKAIAREAGVRSKIAVTSTDMRIDAVGAFVGMKGTRVQSVMRELNGERIDILPWTRDKLVLASQALAPATVLHMGSGESFNRETGEMEEVFVAVVPDDHLSLAIGRNGHNVRLAGNLVERRIDLKTQSQWEEENRWQNMLRVDVSELPGVTGKLAERLSRAGFDSAQMLLDAKEEDLLEVQGVGPVKVAQLVAEASELVEKRVHQIETAKKLEEKSSAESDEEENTNNDE